MNIMVTGVAGFLGSHIAEAFLPEHTVAGMDNLMGGDIENVPQDVAFFVEDCQNLGPDDFRGIDVVYHCAALAHEGLSVFSPHTITNSIFGASVATFSAAAAAGVKRIVFCSSMARYGDGWPPFRESHAPKPKDPYGIAKVAAEEVLKVLSEVHGFEYVIAVPHNIIGPRQKYDDPYRNVAAIMANLMLQGRAPFIYGDGRQKRCFSDIRDLIDGFVQLGTGDFHGEVINMGPDEEFVTINELAMRLDEIIWLQKPPIYLPDRPQEVKYAVCSSDKARRLLGYETKYTLEETLASIVGWIMGRGTKEFQYHLPIEIPSDKCPVTWAEKRF